MGYIATLIYLVLIFVRPQEYVEAIKGWPVQDVAAILCISSVFLEGSLSIDKLKRSPINLLLIMFWIWISITWLFNGWVGGIPFVFLRFTPVVVTFFLIVVTVDTLAKLRGLAWLLALMALFLAIQAIVQYNTGEGLGGVSALQAHGLGADDEMVVRVRGVGLFADPNDMAINMVPFAALLLPAFHRRFMSRTWLTGIIVLVPLTVGIAFTLSRGGMLGMLAIGWFYMYRRVGKLFSIVGAVLLLLVILAAPRVGEINTREDSARARLDHWAYGLQLARENPVFGVGKGAFTENYYRTAHNSFILVLAETGFIGAMIWVAMFIAAFREIYLTRKEPRAPPWLDPALNAFEAALIGWLVCAMFLSQTYKFTSFIILGCIVATLNVLKREGYEVKHPWNARMSLLVLATTVGAVILMHVAVKVLWQL